MPELTDRSHSEREIPAPVRGSLLIGACLAATWFVWGSTYLAIKFALISIPPFLGMGARFIVAGTLLISWTVLRGQPLPSAVQWRNAAIVGALMLGGGMGATAFAEQTVASGLVVAFIAVTPGVITLLNLFFGIRPSKLETLGIAVGFAGVIFLTRGAAFMASPGGAVAILLGSFCWSLGSVLSQHKFPLAAAAPGFASEMLCGGVTLLVLSLLWREAIPRHLAAKAVAAWVYLVIFGSLIAFNAYMTLLARTSAALATSYTFVNPVIAMLLGVSLGGELVTSHEWLASAVVIVGVVILIIGRARSSARV